MSCAAKLPNSSTRKLPNSLTELLYDSFPHFETRLTEADLRGLLKKLGLRPREILRQDEPLAKELGLGKRDFSDEELIAFMAKHPDLIQRPIVVCGDQAVLGRPPENVEKLL